MRVVHMRSTVVAAIAFVALLLPAGGASAAVPPAPGWAIESFPSPTNFSTEQNTTCLNEVEGTKFAPCDAYVVLVTNAGSAATDGSEVVLTDSVPTGLTVQRVSLFVSAFEEGSRDEGEVLCTKTPVRCEYPGELAGQAPASLQPDATLKMIVYVTVDPGASGTLTNTASVSGGNAPAVTAHSENAISSSPAPFGLSNFSFSIDGQDGTPDTQAGDHPYELDTQIGFDNAFRELGPEGDNVARTTSVQDVKDVVVNLPLGFVGSTLAAPQCPLAQLAAEEKCPTDTIVGQIVSEPSTIASIRSPIYNVVPEHGVPAEFGYVDNLHGEHVFYTHVVPTPTGYVLQTTNPDIPAVSLDHVSVTFYGDPAAKQEELAQRAGEKASALPHVPFFTEPTNCGGGELTATLYMDSWQNPARFNPDGSPVNLEEPAWAKAESKSPPVTGCDLLQFPAELQAQPTTHEADKPSGLEFELKVPQSETMGIPGTPSLRKIVTTLPEGLTVDPSAGDGLAACSEAQIGWLGGSHLNFSPAPPQCPEASKIGSLELETPLVAHKFEGEMFLASQNENPFGATLAAYVVVHDPITGVLIKIPGEFIADKSTGRLTAIFDENPNLPFSDLKLHFFGGPRAELATPESCGTYTTNVELFPYSFPSSGPPTTRSDSFEIDEACPSGFAPKFSALSTNVQAGAYTPFIASFSRADADQELTGLTATLPRGLLGKITGVPLCTETEVHEAEAGTGGCPESTRVGTVQTGVGPGPNPLVVSGKAYLTGPYNGGPYGLAVVVPAVAGPYDFGTVVVRQSIRIDPRTAQVSDVSDPFPTIIDGIPLRLRRVTVTLDRPEFTFNPTSCSTQALTGSIAGSPLGAPRVLGGPHGDIGYTTQTSAGSAFSAPFQVTDCASLRFAPKFHASTKARATRLGGASLSVKLSYPKAPWGSQSNIGHVKVSLPKQLPSRLTTLQKACTAAQFNANPAGCPAASIVGHAVVHTPVLPAPLSGPAYFVSNGNQAFPNLIMVLQGNNVTVQLVGDTFISKKGITSSTFKSVPDVPFSTFELTLGQGPHSALAANLPSGASGSFCGRKLLMPTELVAQDGAVFKQKTKMAVTGCHEKHKQVRRSSHGNRATHGGKRR